MSSCPLTIRSYRDRARWRWEIRFGGQVILSGRKWTETAAYREALRVRNRLNIIGPPVPRPEPDQIPSQSQRDELEELLATNRKLERLVIALSAHLDAQGTMR